MKKIVFSDSVKKGTLSLIDQSLCSGTNFITAVLIARATSKEEFGYYTLAFALLMFLAGIQSSLLATPYTVLYPSWSSKQQAHRANVIQVQQLLFSLVTVLLLAVTSLVVVQVSTVDDSLRRLLWVLPVATLGILLREHLRRMYFAALKMEAVSTLDLAVMVLQLGGIAVLFTLGLVGAANAYVVVAIACMLPSFVALGFKIKSIARAGPGFAGFVEYNWPIGRWRLGTHLAISIGTKAYPWLLAVFHGPAAAAVYGACMSLFVVANPFMMGIRNFLVPKLSHHAAVSTEHVKSLVHSSSRLIAAVMGAGFVIICIFGGSIVAWVYSVRYAGNGDVVCILALATLMWSLTAPHTDGLLALKRPDVELRSYLVAAAVSFTVGVYLVIEFGVLGAAVGILLSDGIAALIRYMAFRRIAGSR